MQKATQLKTHWNFKEKIQKNASSASSAQLSAGRASGPEIHILNWIELWNANQSPDLKWESLFIQSQLNENLEIWTISYLVVNIELEISLNQLLKNFTGPVPRLELLIIKLG